MLCFVELLRPLPFMADMQLGNYLLYGEPVGSGAFGVVRKCCRVGQPLPPPGAEPELVGKLVFQGPMVRKGEESLRQEEARREILILSSLEHRNVAELVDLVVGHGYVLYVMKYERCGDLLQFLHDTMQRPMREQEAAHAFRQILEAVRFLHHHKVIHRDLKPGNILVAAFEQIGDLSMPTLKITDFGLSKMCDDNADDHMVSFHQHQIGTKSYMAPEMYYGRYDKGCWAADNFSLGVILYYLLTLSFPGDGFEESHGGKKIPCPCLSTQASLDADIEMRVPIALQPLARALLRLDLVERKELGAVAALHYLGQHFPALSTETSSASHASSTCSSSMAAHSTASTAASSRNCQQTRDAFRAADRDQEMTDLEIAWELQEQENLAAAQELGGASALLRSPRNQHARDARCGQHLEMSPVGMVGRAAAEVAQLVSPLLPAASRTLSAFAAGALATAEGNGRPGNIVRQLMFEKRRNRNNAGRAPTSRSSTTRVR